jgi:hypothetical protein
MPENELTIRRRVFLKLLAITGFAGPAALSYGCGSTSSSNNNGSKAVAYKLSRRGHDACNACRSHAENKLFLTMDYANSNRAHVGCNCRIKPVWIPKERHKQYFARGPVYDRRRHA